MFCAVKLGYIHWNYDLGQKIALNVNEAAEETAVQPENGRALKEEPEKEKKVLTPEEMEKRRKFIVIPAFVLVFLGVMY